MAGLIIGEKSGQSQQFTQKGDIIPVTLIKTTPCYLVGIFTKEKNGYSAIKLGFGTRKHLAKPVEGQLKKAGIQAPLRNIREIRVSPSKELVFIEEEGKQGVQFGEQKVFVGCEIKPAQVFTVGDMVDVTGISKGKGFQGVVRRHNFRGGPKTHGQSDRHRAPGSIGATTTPGRVFKGTRMGGRMGGGRVTIQKLEIVAVAEDAVTIKGLIPGNDGGIIEVRTVGIAKK